MSMGCTYKFFESSISYTIFYLSPSILCLPIMLLIPYTSSSIPPSLLPTKNPPCDVHFSDSIPVLVVCLVFVFIVFFLFYFLNSFVDSCESVVILLFIFLIFLFLDKSLHIIMAWWWWTPLTWPYRGSTLSALSLIHISEPTRLSW